VLTDEVSHLKGSTENPMDDDDLNRKFDGMIGYVLPAEQARACRDALWSIDRHATLEPVASLLRRWSWRGPES